jgi:hypothetical protein
MKLVAVICRWSQPTRRLVPEIVPMGVQIGCRLDGHLRAKDDLEATNFTTGTGTNEAQGLTVATTVTGMGGAGTFVIW